MRRSISRLLAVILMSPALHIENDNCFEGSDSDG